MISRKPMMIFVGERLKTAFFQKCRELGMIPSRVAWTLIQMFTFGFLDQTALAEHYRRINEQVKQDQTERLLKNRYIRTKKVVFKDEK